MKMAFTHINAILIATLSFNIAFAQDNNWPQFRGVAAAGVADGDPPTTWDVDDGTNIAWKVEVDGLGHSAPIVWEDKVFLTTAVGEQNEKPSLSTGWEGANGQSAADSGKWTWKLLCLNRKDGKLLWSRDCATAIPEFKRHTKASHANCTPVTNGEHVVAFFGSDGLFCYDLEGNLAWEHDFGKLHSGPYNMDQLEWGFASSPVIHEDYLIVQCDCLNDGFISILNLKDGKEVRRIKRNDVATWSTPNVISWQGKTQIVCNGFKEMAGYDFDSGEQLWTLSGGGDVPVPTPLFHDGMIYISNAHAGNHCYAISADAKGDISPKKKKDADNDGGLPEGLVWHDPRGGSYMPTPIIVGDLHYTCDDRGILAVRNAKTGEEVYKQRAFKSRSRNFTASPVATKDRLYLLSENGTVAVVKAGEEYKLLAMNSLNDVIMATPAIAGDQLFIRTISHLLCIQQED